MWTFSLNRSRQLYVGRHPELPGYIAGFVCDDFGNLILRYEWMAS